MANGRNRYYNPYGNQQRYSQSPFPNQGLDFRRTAYQLPTINPVQGSDELYERELA